MWNFGFGDISPLNYYLVATPRLLILPSGYYQPKLFDSIDVWFMQQVPRPSEVYIHMWQVACVATSMYVCMYVCMYLYLCISQ